MESETNNFLNWVEIKNFKSIKDLRMDCKRVNVFIGKPNVGKSNILEGLGLLGADYSSHNEDILLRDFVRFDSMSNLFYDDDIVLPVRIRSKRLEASIEYDKFSKTFSCIIGNEHWFDKVAEVRKGGISTRAENKENVSLFSEFLDSPAHSFLYNIDHENFGAYNNIQFFRFGANAKGENALGMNGYGYGSPIKRYEFVSLTDIDATGENFLLPPYGNNLFNVIDHNEDIRKDLVDLFKPNGLSLVLSKKDRKLSVQKQIDGYVYDYPYTNIADTFQRFTFYLAAIESNTNSVIVIEEPEVHSFPPYTQDVAYRMIYSETNQFFVSTHSPYLLHTLVENLKDDQLNVFVTYYENYETKVKALTPEELSFVQEYSTDIFFNLDRFIPNAESASIS